MSKADIIIKNSKKGVWLRPRSRFQRAFNVGDWTVLRWVMVVAGSNTSGLDDDMQLENILFSSIDLTNPFFIGLKNSENSLPPLSPGTYGFGTSLVGLGNLNPGNPFNAIQPRDSFWGYRTYVNTESGGIGWTGGNKTNSTTDSPYPLNFNSSQSSGYFRVYFQEYTIENKGMSNQSVKIGGNADTTADPSIENMRAVAGGLNATSVKTITYHDGGTPCPIPNSIYIQWPFYNNRMIIYNMEVQKIA